MSPLTSLLPPSTSRARPSGVFFIGLNAVRLLSLLAMLLFIASTIVVMVSDLKDVQAWIKAGTPSSGIYNMSDNSTLDCNEIQYSSIPNQIGGPFYSVFSRVIVIVSVFILVASEIGGPRLVRVFFERYLPPLGPAFGLGFLGFAQCFLATTALAHYLALFPQICSWFLFVIGCINFVLGYFSTRTKTTRLIFSFENLSTLTPQTSMAYSAYSALSSSSSSSSSSKKEKDAAAAAPPPPRDEEEAFARSPHVGRIPHVTFGGATKVKKDTDDNGKSHGVPIGWGNFGKKGEAQARLKGYLISKPQSVVPKI